MKILAFDSTARAASVAVCENERLLGLYNIDNGLTQSELLLPMAEELLKSLKLTFSDIGLFACSTGPGSFTGVRIGAALVKGLAFGRNIPCASISTLEELAENLFPLVGILVSVMDARRGQVYTATFRCDGESLTRLSPDRAIGIQELARELAEYGDEAIYLSGDGYELTARELSKCGVSINKTPELLISENAYSVAKAAYRKHLRGEAVTDSEISATYLRLPQAERERLERINTEKKD